MANDNTQAERSRALNPMSFDLTGQVAVVTGGNGGLGRAIALGLASAGSRGGININAMQMPVRPD